MEPLFLFAPGAGAPSSHRWMRHWADLLRGIGQVRTLDYDYMLAGRRRPDPLPQLLQTHRKALADARASHAGPIILAGKSMGARVGCHLALTETVHALVCFGYPLCGGGDPGKLRDKVLRELAVPVLFLQGTRDSLCPLALLQQVRAEMPAPNELHVVASGDHSLLVSKKQLQADGATQAEVDARILEVILEFVTRKTAGV
ncbi:MAG: alpha/beta hydrolase family protein [Chthoniobacterales bacterium]